MKRSCSMADLQADSLSSPNSRHSAPFEHTPIRVTADMLSVLPIKIDDEIEARDFNMGKLKPTMYGADGITVYTNPGGNVSYIVKKNEYAVLLFYKGASVVGPDGKKESFQAFSNFATKRGTIPITVKGSDKKVMLSYSELYFKLGCHFLPTHGQQPTADFIKDVCQMKSPSDIKKSTNSIVGFDVKGWNEMSRKYMLGAKIHDATNPAFFDAICELVQIASDGGVTEIIFVEATNNDNRWGSGVDLREMEKHLAESNLSFDEAKKYITAKGKNLLGEVMGEVLECIRSCDFDIERFIHRMPPLFELVDG